MITYTRPWFIDYTKLGFLFDWYKRYNVYDGSVIDTYGNTDERALIFINDITLHKFKQEFDL